jgi:hypothetical protein
VYSFSASAVGFSAHIRRPKDILIESQAASALGSIAGLSKAKAAKCLFFKGQVCFRKAYSYCDGDFKPPSKVVDFTHSNHEDNSLPTETVIAAGVSGTEFRNRRAPKTPERLLAIGHASFRLTNSNSRVKGCQSEFKFDPKETALDKIAIDGCRLKVTLATELFNRFPTQDALKTAWEGDPAFVRDFGHLFEPLHGQQHTRSFPANDSGVTLATVVHKVEWADARKTAPEVTFDGPNRVRIEGMGTLILGELIITPNSRRVSMFRIDLGSHNGGGGEGGSGETNGGGYP